MKHFGCILEFTAERNRELMRAYRQKLAESTIICMPQIFKMVADSPCSRFWVSEERACIVVSAMIAGKHLPDMRDNKREMFEEIRRRVVALQKGKPSLSLFEAVSIVVNQPAPKFYMTPRTIGELIYRIKNGWYDRQYDRYRHLFK